MKFTLSSALVVLSAVVSTVLAAPHPASASSVATSTAGNAPAASSAAATNGTDEAVEQETPSTWTVIVDNDDPRTLEQMIADMGDVKVNRIYNNTAFKGFSCSMASNRASVMSMTGLKTFERDIEIKVAGSQVNAPWGLQRLSQGQAIQSAGGLDEAKIAAIDFTYQFEGGLNQTGALGKDVDIYIIDTGINVDHVDFDGRASFGFTIDDETDSQGHGTHCAGTAASTTFGVAKNANIIAVKVLGPDSGFTSDILAGIDWMMQNHEKRMKTGNFAGSVASMSLGSLEPSTSLNEAIAQANANGIHFSVAAGNEERDACLGSPGSAVVNDASNAIVVGATTITDERASFSNFGDCTTLYAPGQDITSTWVGSTNKINTISGTSMACPHVSGLIAYTLSQNPSLKTDTKGMKAFLVQSAQDLEITEPSGDTVTVKYANNGFIAPRTGAKLLKRTFSRL
ncbi:peptidase S8/S53 domain-containing protein [Tricharina praecox]|uniref:peptidase S8/S53 domain-containing protein n=1 Tax=Tricharina praecox TaxID=43433 RepID=UPI00222123B5|nr:peptidase S8/S53 domain-containing protein [Tricharina praecox]KAI5849168.1 peptidase S8/S53 domain-containing protein [Tricharina praecox]